MYFDEDGVATNHSQAVYEARIRLLLFASCLLSFVGFGTAVLNGDYTRERLQFPTFLNISDLLEYSNLLWPLILLHSLGLNWKDGAIHTYAAGIRGSIISILFVVCKVLARFSNSGKLHFGLSLDSTQLYTATLLAIVQVLFPRRPDVFTPEGKLVDLERSASAFSRYSMRWCTAALSLAGKHVPINELPALDYLTRSKSQPSLLTKSPDTTLWNRILVGRYLGFVKQWTLMFVQAIMIFGSPYYIMRLLKSLEDNQGRADYAWIWLIGIGISSICQTVVSHQLVWIQWSEMGVPLRAQLIMAIFQKAMRRKDSKSQRKSFASKTASSKPEAINLIASDTLSLAKFSAVNYIIPSSFLKFFFAVLFLWNLLRWQSTLVGLFITVLCIPVHTFFIRQQREAQRSLMAARDKKTKAITEALHALRQIKFSASEFQWEEYIKSNRDEEMNQLRWTFATNNMKSIFGVTAPFLVAIASICTYAYIKGSLTPSIIFPMIEVLPQLQGTLGFVPVVFLDYFNAKLNASRIDILLRKPEQQTVLGPSPSGRIIFQDASIRWPSDTMDSEDREEKSGSSPHLFSLHGVNLEFPAEELSVISGKTGSGKSLLLAAIIGEIDLLGGSIDAPSIAQGLPTAYVSQTPWLQNATIRENILFGKPFDKDRYEKVLTACAFRPDLVALANGDGTEIGLRGVKLSGGQRARLAFGRALYSNSQLLVLDDIFSALGSHVAKEIFDALTGEPGRGRTRILVTHQVSLCLPKTKYIVVVGNNSIKYAGAPDLMKEGLEFVGTEEAVLEPRSSPLVVEPRPATADTTPKFKAAVKKAKRINARTSSKVYKKYFAAAGGPLFLSFHLLGLAIKQLLNAVTTWLLGRVKSAGPKILVDQPEKSSPLIQSVGNRLQQHLYLYLIFSLMVMGLQALFNRDTFSGSLRASKVLFGDITSRAIRMPLLWIDTTSMGEMLKKFTVDTQMVDDQLLMSISDFAEQFVKVLIVVAVGLCTSKYTSFLTGTLLIFCARVSRSYIKARTTVRRADAEPTSAILEHFGSSAAGISTIRAFGVVEATIDQMHQHVDRLSTARRHLWIFNRWLGLQMSLLGILFSIGTGIILLSSKSFIDASLIGFSLTFSMGFSQAMTQATNYYGVLETQMDAVGRVIEYTELETEGQAGIEVRENWPSKGKVEVKGLDVAYSANLPLVLKDVSFTVEGSQSIGIVGRTGAGKSSLTLSLLRLIEPQSGSILVDGIDISTVKLQELRTRIAFIPQDPVLFSGTVRSNLDYFKQIPEDKLLDALRRVQLLAEDGDEKSGLFTLDSPISTGGSNMSQGQRQLLCLARVLIKKPKIMILDEATSAVDNTTDLLIQDTIKKEFEGTLIVVAHRLRTIARFDQVMVMSDGKVVEIGKPDELLRKKGMFYELVEDSQDGELLIQAILKEKCILGKESFRVAPNVGL